MNFKLYQILIVNVLTITTLHAATLHTPTAPATVAAKATPAPTQDIPYLQELHNAKMSPAIVQGWQQLYQQFLQANDTSSPHPRAGGDPVLSNSLFSINFFEMMATYLNPKTLAKFVNDPQGQIHFNYATTHLRDAVTRLGSITSIVKQNGTPTANVASAPDKAINVAWVGDCRDMGIIVNIQNNTQAQFSINQRSLDGKTTIQIGELIHGLNEVNLHTAALQTPAAPVTKTSKTTATSETLASATTTNFFEIVEVGAQNPTNISLKIFTGAELVTFLESLPRKKANVVEMNGLPTSPEYLANPQDWYMVLIQNPPAQGATKPNPDQRIQAINLSKLTGPYLLTMQINQESVEIKPAQGKTPAVMMDVFQPSLNNLHIIKNPLIESSKFPLIILPQFLWNLPTLQATWMLLHSTMIATLTNFKFFGTNTFGNAFEYFTNLGCFDKNNKYKFCIDLYNTLPIGTKLFDAPWIIGTAVYETLVKSCEDLPQIHSGENKHQECVGNNKTCFYMNIQAILHAQKKTTLESAILFKEQGFTATYGKSENQALTLIFSLPTTDMQEGVFAELTKQKNGVYQFIWTNKKNEILNNKNLYLFDSLSKIDIAFISQSKAWTGSHVPQELLNLKSGIKNNFKVTYESISAQNKYMLVVNPTSPIDKSNLLYTIYFSKFPITDLVYDLYETFKGQNFTRCNIIQNSNLPTFLSNLTIQDWQNGIYLISNVQNQHHLSTQHSGSLTITFYKSDKTLLGSITNHGLYENNPTTPGIRHPVKTSIINSNAFKPLLNIFLSTGVLLKYSQD